MSSEKGKIEEIKQLKPASDELNQSFSLQLISKRAVERNPTFLCFRDNVGVNTAEQGQVGSTVGLLWSGGGRVAFNSGQKAQSAP